MMFLCQLTDEQAAWLVEEAPKIPQAFQLVQSAMELYQFDGDRDEFVDTIRRVIATYRK